MIFALFLALIFVQFDGPVTRIIDGDTFVLDGDVHVRIWGLNAPEKGDEGANEAKAALARLISGGYVVCEHKGTSFNRIVARCWIGGKDIAQSMIEGGYATEACDFSKGEYGRCD